MQHPSGSRSGLFAPLLVIGFFIAVTAPVPAESWDAYIGTYTGGDSRGIYHFTWDDESGEAGKVSLAAECTNPSFLAVHPSGGAIYAVLETAEWEGIANSGGILALMRGEGGKLRTAGSRPTYGAAPCHLEIHPSGKFVLFANYTGGSIACMEILDDHMPGALTGFIQYTGSSINRARQQSPHAHSIHLSPDGSRVLSADLGLDRVHVHGFDSTHGRIMDNPFPAASLAPGAGPRHFAFHPGGKLVLVLNELSSRLTCMHFDPVTGRMEQVDEESTLPSDFVGSNSTAEVVIHPNGRFVYASNRGHDSIAVFAISRTGDLKLLNIVPTRGRTPRNFTLDPTGNWLLAANQNSDSITLFTVNPASGSLTPHGDPVRVPTPVCIRFAPRL
jgi:6-phosphogluconolactonase